MTLCPTCRTPILIGKATWFDPKCLLAVRRDTLRENLDSDYRFKRFVASFGLEYRFTISPNVSEIEGQKLYNLEKENAKYQMEDELTKWIIKQWREHFIEQIHGFTLVETTYVHQDKPIILIHPADLTYLKNRIVGFSLRFGYPPKEITAISPDELPLEREPC